ncbi:carbohydrate ABC transporter substrate-binding protein, CUT1 family [Desulfosporosinus meridiei DSM 13257]|uniref:Carbohydrate ABC transporter substrate-binding protein, CUT1 family n=2 Tax=Desulfosporosinus TaxID=79206 RepID=J7IX68_DESMD|nr:carbohydrate ABC transporter substrate-binding protein, CUT1 family [Desulfosporosinus meridiei DSM 13257]
MKDREWGAIMTSRRFLLIVIVSIILVTGCSSAPQTGQPGGPAPVVVDVWHSLQGAEAEALKGQVQAVEQTNPEVIVKLNYVSAANFAAFSYQAEAGGEGPEIFIASREIIHELYSKGALATVAHTDSEAYPATLAAFRFGGVEYALPWLTDIPLLYFRTDLTEAPAALTDIFAAKGVSMVSPDTATLAVWWNGQGGRLLNSENISLNDPNNLLFIQQLLAWKNAKLLRIDPTAPAAFANGQTPYLIAGASLAKYFTQLNVPWGSIPLSDLTGGQGQGLIGATLGIANSAIKSTPAMIPAIQTVEKALLTPEAEEAMLNAVSLLPANMSFYGRPEAQKGVFPQASKALAKAWSLEGNSQEWKLIPLQNEAWNNVLTGNITPEDALNIAQEQAGKVLSVKEQP